MNASEVLSEKLKRHFKVTVPSHQLQKKIELRLSKLGSKAKIPGFRPGKAPISVLKQHYLPNVFAEAVDDVINEAVAEVLSQQNLKPILRPAVDVEKVTEEEGVEFLMKFEIFPAVPEAVYEGIELTRYVSVPSDAKIQETIAKLGGVFKKKESLNLDRPAAQDDVVLIDFEGFVDQKPIKGGKADDFQLKLGSGSLIPGFEEQIIGMKNGEEKTILVTFPVDYNEKKLAGKEASFNIKLKDIIHFVDSPVDADLATRLGFESLEALQNHFKQEAETALKSASFLKVKKDLLDVFADKYAFDVPEQMLDLEFQNIWSELLKEVGFEEGMDLASLLNDKTSKTEEQLKEEYKVIAERRVRLGLLLADIGQKNKVEVTNEELMRALQKEASNYPGQEREVINYYRKNQQALAFLRAPIFEDKVVDFILGLSKVTEKEISPEEMEKFAEEDNLLLS